jgi:hypothetical protein
MRRRMEKIGPCEVCGEATSGSLCGRCAAATIDDDGVRKVFTRLELPEPTELEKRRLSRLSPAGRFMVGVVVESWRRSGAPVTLSEAIHQVEEIERR